MDQCFKLFQQNQFPITQFIALYTIVSPMRSLYTRDLVQNNAKPHNRSRLKSLKQLRELPTTPESFGSQSTQHQLLQLLQKKLSDFNSKEENEEAHNTSAQLSQLQKKQTSKHTIKQLQQKKLQELIAKNKLFQYFEQTFKREVPEHKVEREKVNFCERQFEDMRLQVDGKIQANVQKMTQIQHMLKGKYLQLHEYHEQLKDLAGKEKMEKRQKQREKQALMQKRLRLSQGQMLSQSQVTMLPQPVTQPRSISLRPPSLKEKIYLIQETINFIKKQISGLEEEVESIKSKEESVKEQWIGFLKLFLACGYYLGDGTRKILLEMKRLGMKLEKGHLLGQALDEQAKNFLILWYVSGDVQHDQLSQSSINNHNRTKNSPYAANKSPQTRPRIQSNIQLSSIIKKQSNLKQIYSNTRQAVTQLLKHQNFRLESPQTKPQSFLPRIQPKTLNPSSYPSKKLSLKNSSRMVTVDVQGISDFKGNSGENYEQYHKLSNSSRQSVIDADDIKRQQVNRINYVYGNDEQKARKMKRILFGFGVK